MNQPAEQTGEETRAVEDVPIALFERKAARTGRRAFDTLRKVCDARGFLDDSHKELAEKADTNVRSFREGLARLRRIGLVCWMRDNHTGRMRTRIVGKISGDILRAPEGTLATLTAMSGWGGSRSGAGRPAADLNNDYYQIDPSATADLNNENETPEAAALNSDENAADLNEKPNDSAKLHNQDDSNSPGGSPSPPRSSSNTSVISHSSPSESRSKNTPPARAAREDSPSSPDSGPTSNEPPPEALDGIAEALAGGSDGEPPGPWHRPGVPPFPGPTVVEPARVPPPPLLDAGADDEVWFKQIAKAWRGTTMAFFGGNAKDAWIFKKQLDLIRRKRTEKNAEKITKSKHYQMLLDAGAKFIEHDISPAAWIAFSFDVWAEYGDGDTERPPPPKWVFGTKRIDDRRGWFRNAADEYRGGKVFFSPPHKALIRRHTTMRRDLRKLPVDAEQTRVEAVVEKHFPNNMHELLTARAVEATREMNTQLEKFLADGEWLWSGFDWVD